MTMLFAAMHESAFGHFSDLVRWSTCFRYAH